MSAMDNAYSMNSDNKSNMGGAESDGAHISPQQNPSTRFPM